MSLTQRRAASVVRRVWRQERGDIAQVAVRVALAAEGVGNLSTALGGGAARGLLEMLQHNVLPNHDREEAIVHPVIDRLTGTSQATRLLVPQLEHLREMSEIVQADWEGLPRAPTRRQFVVVRAHLRRLGAVLRAYMDQQERVLGPVFAAAGT